MTDALFATLRPAEAKYAAIRRAAARVRRSRTMTEAAREAEIDAISCWCDSSMRLPCLLAAMGPNNEPALFWRMLARHWSVCDAAWKDQPRLLTIMRQHRTARPLIDGPEHLTVYRGCSRARVRGISWTTDRAIAERFAQGHRSIPVPQPVIVSGRVARKDCFLFIDDRNEREVLLDPERVKLIATG